MKANYITGCGECKDYIKVGEEIVWSPELQTWVHDHCAGEPNTKPTRFEGTSLEDMGF